MFKQNHSKRSPSIPGLENYVRKIGDIRGHGGGGQVVSKLALYSNDPSLNPADAYCFSVKCVFEKYLNKHF